MQLSGPLLMPLLPAPGCCEFCPRVEMVPAVRRYTDVLGFEYRLCERHFAPLRAWLLRKEERERRKQLLRRERTLDPGRMLPVEEEE